MLRPSDIALFLLAKIPGIFWLLRRRRYTNRGPWRRQKTEIKGELESTMKLNSNTEERRGDVSYLSECTTCTTFCTSFSSNSQTAAVRRSWPAPSADRRGQSPYTWCCRLHIDNNNNDDDADFCSTFLHWTVDSMRSHWRQ